MLTCISPRTISSWKIEAIFNFVMTQEKVQKEQIEVIPLDGYLATKYKVTIEREKNRRKEVSYYRVLSYATLIAKIDQPIECHISSTKDEEASKKKIMKIITQSITLS